jgi:hypothetical protein
MSVKRNGKFLPKHTIDYSPTIFGSKAPLLNVSFEDLPRPVPALVDSGATNSLLHPAIASKLKLKIDYDDKKLGTGAGGSFEYVKAEPVSVEILGENFKVAFDIPLDNDFAWPCILGHNSIFEYSKIVFKSYKEKFDVFLKVIN